MKELWEDVIQPFLIILLVAISILSSVVFCVYKYTVEVAEANIITATCDNKIVYTGKKAFVEITSGGMTTTLTIYKKLFPFEITEKVYSSSNIKIE